MVTLNTLNSAPGPLLGYGAGLGSETTFDGQVERNRVTPIFSDPNSPSGLSALLGDPQEGLSYQPVVPVIVEENLGNGFEPVFDGFFTPFRQDLDGGFPGTFQPGMNPFNDFRDVSSGPINPNYGGTPVGQVPDGYGAPFNPSGGTSQNGIWQSPSNGQWYDGNGNVIPPPANLGPDGIFPDGTWQDPGGYYHRPDGISDLPPDQVGSGNLFPQTPNGEYMTPDGQWHNADGDNISGPTAPNGPSNPNGPGGPPNNQNDPQGPHTRPRPKFKPGTKPITPTGPGKFCIAIRGHGTGGEVYSDSALLSLCAETLQVGQPIPASYAEQENARTADNIKIFSYVNTRVVSRNVVNVDAESGGLYLKGEQEALLWSPIYVSIFQQNVAGGGPLLAALTMEPDSTTLGCYFSDLNLISMEDMNLDVGVEGSSNGNLNISVAANIDMKAGVGADPGIGDIDILANNELTLIADKPLYIASTSATISLVSYSWYRLTATNATEFSGMASNHICIVKGNEETWIGRDEEQFSYNTIIDSAQGTTINCNAADIQMLAGGLVHIEASTDIILEGVNAYIGNDANSDPWKRLVHEDFVYEIFNNHFHGGVQSGSDNSHLPSHTGNSTHMTYFAKGN